MANQNIKVRISSSSAKYFYAQVSDGQGTNSSAWIPLGQVSSGSLESSEFSSSKFTGYDALHIYTSDSDLSGSLSSSNGRYNAPSGMDSYPVSSGMYHADQTSYASRLRSNTYYINITYTQGASSAWSSWTHYTSSDSLIDTTGPTTMTASFVDSTNGSIKLVFDESPRDSSGNLWTADTFPSGSYMQWTLSGSGTTENISIEGVSYTTTNVANDTVVLTLGYDGSVASGDTLSFLLSASYAVYDADGNMASPAGGSEYFQPSSAMAWPTTGVSPNRTHTDRTYKFTNSHASTTYYFYVQVDSSEAPHGSSSSGASFVKFGPVTAGQTVDGTISSQLQNDGQYSYGTQYSIYASTDDITIDASTSSISGTVNSTSVYSSGYGTQPELTSDVARLEWTFDGSNFSSASLYKANGDEIDIAVSTPTVTVSNSGGSGTITFDFGERIWVPSGGYASSFSDLTDMSLSWLNTEASAGIANSGGSATASNLSLTSVDYATSDSTGAMAIYGTDSTGNSYGTGWFYPVYLSEADAGGSGSSHSHTFSEYSGTFYMPDTGSNHAQSQKPSGYVFYQDQLVVSFTYSGDPDSSDYISLGAYSSIYDAGLYYASFTYTGPTTSLMQQHSSSQEETQMSTKISVERVKLTNSLIPHAGDQTARDLGSSSKKWQNAHIESAKCDALTLNGTLLSVTAAELNDLAGNAVDASDFTKLAAVTSTAAELSYLRLDDLEADDFVKLAGITSSSAEINLLAGMSAGEIIVGGAILSPGAQHTVMVAGSSGAMAYSLLDNNNLAASAGIVSSKIAELDSFDTDDLSEGSSSLYFTDARARAAISVTDSTDASRGSMSYDSSTGVLTYTGISAAQVRGDLSVSDAGGDGSLAYNSSTGVITYTGPSAAEVRAHFSAGEGINLSAGAISGQDASTSNKGIASFSSDNFAVSSGAVTIKDGGVANAELANSALTIGTTAISLGGFSTTLAGMTGIDFAEGDASIAAQIGENNLTLGGADSTIIVAGDLTVSGTTTTVNSTEVTIADKAIVLASGSDDAGVVSGGGSGLKIGSESSPLASFLYDGADSFDSSEDMTLANGKAFKIFPASGAAETVLDADGAAKVGSGVAGDGLAHDSGVLSVDVDDSSIEVDGTSGKVQVKALGVTNAMLANSTISGVSLGATLGALSDGNGIADFSYTGAGTASIAIQLEESSTGESGLSVGASGLKIAATGVTNAMLAGSIADSKLNQITTGDKVAGSALQLASSGGLEDDSGIKISTSGVVTAMIADNAVTADKLAHTAVTAGQYGSAAVSDFTIPEFTVDAQGRITNAGEKVIQDAAADGSTKGVAAFDSGDFSASSGVIALKEDSVGAAELKDDVAGSGIQVSNGVLSLSMHRRDYIAHTNNTVGEHAIAGSENSRVLTIPVAELGATGTYIANSLQVFLNGLLLKEGASNDYEVSATSSGVFTVTILGTDGDPMDEEGDTASVFFMKA